jgi:hypothetical protein
MTRSYVIDTHSGQTRRTRPTWLAELWWSNGGQIGGQTPVVGGHSAYLLGLGAPVTCSFLAERVGFEPTVSFPTHDFQFAVDCP